MSDLSLKLIEHRKMTKALEKTRDIFSSITCLRAEGVEFFTQSEILDSISRRAHDGYDVCKKALEPQA